MSEHLGILEDASLVLGVKRGRERYHHLNPEPLEELNDWLRRFERYWRDRLSPSSPQPGTLRAVEHASRCEELWSILLTVGLL